jgi:hypothetical protein
MRFELSCFPALNTQNPNQDSITKVGKLESTKKDPVLRITPYYFVPSYLRAFVTGLTFDLELLVSRSFLSPMSYELDCCELMWRRSQVAKARVCKTLFSGSIPLVASKFSLPAFSFDVCVRSSQLTQTDSTD